VTVELVLAGDVGEIVLNRPEKLNALDGPMTSALNQRLDEAEAATVRALLVRGEGRGFCAGRDLVAADPVNEDATAILETIFNPLIRRIATFPAPTFAAVHGACLGVGLGIALACDVVYVADDAKIGSPFANTGGVLDSGGHFFLASRLGSHRALELIYTGRLISGREAGSWGLVNRSVGRGSLVDVVREVATRVAAGPTSALLHSKRLIGRLDEERLGLDDVLAAESVAQGEASRSHDYQEGYRAFLEKRPAAFTGA
jgi:2-(1,2-epoxy-1,2-dihydrophenyl)acetyl-CoA isomerase